MIIEVLMGNLKKRNEEPVTIHANFMIGNHVKMSKMQEHGLWLLKTTSGDGNHSCISEK